MGKIEVMLKPLTDAPDRALSGVALLRIDVNAADTWRLEAVLPTITYLAARAKKVIIMSHKGRPEPGKRLGSLSLASDAQKLADLVKTDVWFISDTDIPAVRKHLNTIPDGSIVVLENIRAFKGEATSSATFAKSLASLGDYYVSDAFPVLHHGAASVTELAQLLPSYAGMRLVEEVERLGSLQERVKRPYVVVIGGAKAKDKLGVLDAVIDKADWVLVGGACANAILALRGEKVGQSVYERDAKVLAALQPYVHHKKVLVPVDYVRSGGKILDIGPKTQRLFTSKIKDAGTILWTGPLGLIEKKRFAKGTEVLARAIARNKRAYSVTGGGETVTFLKQHKLDKGFSFISTGGGAMIEFVAGNPLPGLAALSGRKKTERPPLKKAVEQAFKEIDAPKLPKLAKVYDIFFHDDFDGRASAAVFVDFLKTKGSRIERFMAVEHGVYEDVWLQKDALDTIAGTTRRNPSIVVDFPYHPQATFWYDHHPTAFRKPEWQNKFDPSAFQYLDTSYASACHLVLDRLVEDHGYVPSAYIREVVRWADVIDGARYANPFQTLVMREPALQVAAYINACAGDAAKEKRVSEPLTWLIEGMAHKGIDRVAKDPRIQEVAERVRAENKLSLSFYRKHLQQKGNVAIVDTSELTTQKLRYGAYYLAPNAVYGLTISKRVDDSYIVQAGVNPWKRERNAFAIGELLAQFGGGGHPFAGAVRLGTRLEVDKVVDYFTTLFNGTA